MEKNPYEIDFEEYIREGEPDKKEKSIAWSIAIGLQQVDGLKPSSYLYETAKKNIEGELSFDEAKNLIDSYYESRTARNQDDERTEEADKVSSRIAQILSEPSFNFSPSHLIAIHKRLFEGIFKFAGKIRDYDITKKEWILNGDTVMYAGAGEIADALNYYFSKEKNFDYSKLSKEDVVKYLTRFVADIWQIHPFGEGNTRTIAVFTIKYLHSLGFIVNKEPFKKHSWYFRNALVRANYTNMQKGIYMNTEYLEKFFRNILLGENNELKNRYNHIDYDEYMKKLGENKKSSEKNNPINDTAKITQKITVKITVNQQKIIDVIKENPFITQEELSKIVGIARLNINKNMKKLQELGIIKRVGADKNGHWEVIE